MNFQLTANHYWSALILLLSIAVQTGAFAQPSQGERPNIVWVVSEDNSKHYLQLYEADGAPMPNIEAFWRSKALTLAALRQIR